ncbi:MAG: hypothetical protein ACTSXJ_08875 [Candidatus Baldrarchaeia archaeon]
MKSKTDDLREKVMAAISTYNRYHGVEAHARLLEMQEDLIIVEISGSFCATCAPEEYPIDLLCEFMDQLGRDVVLESVEIDNEGGRAIAKYRVL